ncbi:D-amino-acid transaminase [Limoniibacter endophyticus]|uniref:Probable branched-chain-amino-acid aminotransferase n=1 Tax=Limoniibacter endophyticus TaxID=1565040 RepID=A0A8J3DM49_9HYPH|nr:D-amino-acid transaminase [Limoniibacter endophyticus]GHC63810.1 D-alanine aminotransferase [Limoniibacter endophyticus]
MPQADTRIAYVNGAFLPASEASVSIFDRGYLFGDGIYEVAAVIDGKLVDSASHLARLKRSTGEINIKLHLSEEEIENLQRKLIEKNKLKEGLVYLQVTRGTADRDFTYPDDMKPNLTMFTQEKMVSNVAIKTGYAVKSVPDLRWTRRDIKSTCLLAQVLAKQIAKEAGCQEAWMVEDDGLVTEGGSSTAYIVTADDKIITRANSQKTLPGCTRLALLELATEENLAIEERPFSLEEAFAAKEAFVTSASSFVMPVVRIDEKSIGNGEPGPLAMRLRELYIDFAKRTAV